MTKTILLLDGYNNNVHADYSSIGTIVPNNNRWGLTNGWKIIEVYDENEIQAEEKESGR